MVTKDVTEVTDSNVNVIINKIQAECSRRSVSSGVTDAVDNAKILATIPTGEWWWMDIDMAAIVSQSCYCESLIAIEQHDGCPPHCYDYLIFPTVGDKILAADYNELNADIDRHDAACACNLNTVEPGGSSYCSCNVNVLYCGNCSCNNNCTCQELYCTCDKDESGCYYDYSDCWPTCQCQNQCSCLSNCTCVGNCTCNTQCGCDTVCQCEFDET